MEQSGNLRSKRKYMNKEERVFKKAIVFGLVIMFFLSCVGCSVDSENNIIQYAEDRYGANQHIRTVTQSDEVTCYFTDDEYGFEYYVCSYMQEILVDDANFGSTENKGSNFDIQYYNYLCDTLSSDLQTIETKYNVDIQISDGTYIYYFAQVYYKGADTSNVAAVTKEISDLYVALDSRHHFKDLVVEAYNLNTERLGAYHSEQSKWMTQEDEIEWEYIMRIQDLCPQAVYLRKEQHNFTDTGADINEVVTVLGTPEVTTTSMVTYYVFSVDGKEYFMADFMIYNDMGGFEYYTNYR